MAIPLQIKASGAIWSSNLGRTIVDDLAERLSSYRHQVDAVGGYGDADIGMEANQDEIEMWLEEGIGAHIESYDGPEQIYEGFINEINANIGPLSIKRGPLLNVRNKVATAYQTVSYATNPPVGGVQSQTAYAQDTDSQALYGILEQVLSGGQGTTTEAEQVRDTYLEERRLPETSQTLNLQGGGNVSITIQVKGYRELLAHYYYTNTNTGTGNTSDVIEAVLTADPSSRFSADYSSVDANTVQIGLAQDGTRSALDVIQAAMVLGGPSNERWLFGIYNGRMTQFNAIPTELAYKFRITDKAQAIVGAIDQMHVARWNVKAGKWLFFPDLHMVRPSTSTLREDPRNLFIETANYQAPWFVNLTGSRVSKLTQLLAKRGLGGLS